MIRVLFVAIFLSLTACVTAEESPNTITVTGSGSAPATPDRASLRMSIEVRDKSLQVAQKQAADVTAKVLAITDGLDIDRSRVDSTGASVRADYRYDRNTEQNEFRGYIATRDIRVEFRDLEKLAPVIEGAVSAGVNQVSEPTLFSTKQKEAYRQALENAAKDAEANARRLADSLDVSLGSAMSINAAPGAFPQGYNQRGFANAGLLDTNAVETYSAGDQTVRASVTVVFEIDD